MDAGKWLFAAEALWPDKRLEDRSWQRQSVK